MTWDVSHAQKLASPQHGWRSTFAKVDPALFAKFTTHDGDSAPSARQAHDGAPVVLPEDVHTVLDALACKGQVILHGPPGTGKTRLTLGAALALAARCSPGSPKSVCPALPRVSPPKTRGNGILHRVRTGLQQWTCWSGSQEVRVGSCSFSDVQERVWVCTSMYWFVVLRRAHVAWRALSVPARTVLPIADQALGRGYIDA
ncbi:hypothetical protein [Streptomyces sp. CA-106110]|uniref:hypothetical protein n=1 Tax=Streptomyces sp. CA-106110 TaxID=3240044 RepID=UPI003D9457E0